MILPMMGFFLMLMFFGGIGSLATMVDNHVAKKAPIPFAMFFAGVGAYVIFFFGGFLSSYVSPALGDPVALFGAPVVGGIGGAILGYHLSIKRRQRYPEEET